MNQSSHVAPEGAASSQPFRWLKERRGKDMEQVWVFNGGGSFPSGVFSSRDNAEAWIAKDGLSGALTLYPLNVGVYEWAVENGYFKPKNEEQRNARFIQRFTCGHEHYHYEDGLRVA